MCEKVVGLPIVAPLALRALERLWNGVFTTAILGVGVRGVCGRVAGLGGLGSLALGGLLALGLLGLGVEKDLDEVLEYRGGVGLARGP